MNKILELNELVHFALKFFRVFFISKAHIQRGLTFSHTAQSIGPGKQNGGTNDAIAFMVAAMKRKNFKV